MPFGPVDPEFDLVALERDVLQRWREHDVPAEARRLRKGAEPWIFYEGPPTANGRPGLHHVWARVFKDLYPRFQTMRGHDVPRKGGWDCHGLPVELEVEKELGLHSKHEIEAYGVAEFNQRCRDSVHRYVEDWTALTERSGAWIDTTDAYWTLTNDYIESVWWLLAQLWQKGLLYEGHKVSPYCARCGTALSSHELGQPDVYRDVVDPSVYVRFPLVDGSGPPGAQALPVAGADLLVWTTTPWTLISNVAAAVGPDIDYARVPAEAFGSTGRDLIAAVSRLPEGVEPLATFKGHELAGWRYERPFAFLDPPAGASAWRVVAAEYVSVDDGSGIVHLAPAFGEEDAAVGRSEELPVLNPVDADGAFDRRVRALAGPVRQGRRPRHHRRPGRAGPAGARAALRAQLPPLLALWHAADLLGQDQLVRPHLGSARRAAARERDGGLAPRAHQARPVRQVARGQHRLGPLTRPLLGHPAADLALPGLRRRALLRLGGRAGRGLGP